MENRSYGQHCSLARSLDRIGERWTLLLVRELMLGPKRYSQLMASLEGITTNLLAKRLKNLQELGVLEKSGVGPSIRYRLTAQGLALEPVLLELARWGEQFMGQREPGDRLDLAWPLLTLKGRYRGGESMRVALRCEGREFELVLQPDRLLVQEKEGSAPDLVLSGSATALAAFLREGEIVEGLCPPEQELLLRRLAALLHTGPDAVGDQPIAAAAVAPAGKKKQR